MTATRRTNRAASFPKSSTKRRKRMNTTRSGLLHLHQAQTENEYKKSTNPACLVTQLCVSINLCMSVREAQRKERREKGTLDRTWQVNSWRSTTQLELKGERVRVVEGRGQRTPGQIVCLRKSASVQKDCKAHRGRLSSGKSASPSFHSSSLNLTSYCSAVCQLRCRTGFTQKTLNLASKMPSSHSFLFDVAFIHTAHSTIRRSTNAFFRVSFHKGTKLISPVACCLFCYWITMLWGTTLFICTLTILLLKSLVLSLPKSVPSVWGEVKFAAASSTKKGKYIKITSSKSQWSLCSEKWAM